MREVLLERRSWRCGRVGMRNWGAGVRKGSLFTGFDRLDGREVRTGKWGKWGWLGRGG